MTEKTKMLNEVKSPEAKAPKVKAPKAKAPKAKAPGAKSKIDKAEIQRIGNILLQIGLITIDDIDRVIHKQTSSNLRFGEAAVLLGLITADDLERALFQQFSYPQLNLKTSKVSPEVIAAYAPFSEQTEGLRVLRSQLLLRWFTTEQKTLAIVSVDQQEGKSYIAANLATLFSQLGEKTLLIDGNMRQPRQHEIFSVNNDSGLSTVLSGRDEAAVCQQIQGLESLYLLPSGPTPPNPQELISRRKFGEVMEELKKSFDTILIDTPASKLSSDSVMITSKLGGALVVTRRNKTRIADIKRLKQCMEADGVTLAGSILNR